MTEPAWTIAVPGGIAGHPVPYPHHEKASAILVTSGSGKILVLNPTGATVGEMAMDLPPSAPAIAADVDADGTAEIVAVDMWGSVYLFGRDGRRIWKHARESNANGMRVPVAADLDGDRKLEIFTSDARGNMVVLNAAGEPRMDLQTTTYRLSSPSVGDLDGDGLGDIVFGTDDMEAYAVSGNGEMLWRAPLSGRFGRAMPLVADADKDGRYEVYLSSAFNQSRPGLFAIDALTGKLLWKAESKMQSYNSTAVADLEGDGSSEILFGDKNTRLYCLDAKGKQKWSVQVGGRGIFYAPAIADLHGDGKATVFVVARGTGVDGFGMYALDPAGNTVEKIVLEGGGVTAPALMRFEGSREVRLLAYTASGKLQCFRLSQDAGKSRILWAGLRHDAAHSGLIPAAQLSAAQRPRKEPPMTGRGTAVTGTNPISFADARGPDRAVRVQGPDGFVQVRLRPQGVSTSFVASKPGEYTVDANWRRSLLTLEPGFASDDAEFKQFEVAMRTHASEWADFAVASARADLEFAKRRNRVELFDDARRRRDELLALTNAKGKGPLLVRGIANPWVNLEKAQYTESPIALSMLGNEYESRALAVTNIQHRPATIRFAMDKFGATPAYRVVEFRETPLVRPESTGRPTEDVLPLLGEGNTMHLAPLETRKLWLVFHSKDLAKGEHTSLLRIGDLQSTDAPMEIPVKIDVHPVRLPDRLSFKHDNWLYLASIQDERQREATIRDALRHGTNVFCVPPAAVKLNAAGEIVGADSETHDLLVRRLRGEAFFMVTGTVGLKWPDGAKPSPEQSKRAFAEAIRWYGRHMDALGVPRGDYALYVMDEPGLMGHDAAYERYVEQVREIKRADPKMPVYANPAGGARADVLAPLADLVDVWQPDLHLVREQPEELGALFRRGQYWHYEAPADQRNIDPLGYYRVKPWVAFQMGMSGAGYWVYSYSAYWFFNRALTTEYGTVYPTETGPVTTRRWEAARDGAEDFEVLTRVKTLAARSHSEAAQRARKLLDDAVKFATRDQEHASDIGRQLHPFAPDFEQWLSYRDKLIAAWIELEEAK